MACLRQGIYRATSIRWRSTAGKRTALHRVGWWQQQWPSAELRSGRSLKKAVALAPASADTAPGNRPPRLSRPQLPGVPEVSAATPADPACPTNRPSACSRRAAPEEKCNVKVARCPNDHRMAMVLGAAAQPTRGCTRSVVPGFTAAGRDRRGSAPAGEQWSSIRGRPPWKFVSPVHPVHCRFACRVVAGVANDGGSAEPGSLY